MAVVSRPFSRLSSGGSLLFEVFIEIDDTDWHETNDDGDPDDFRVFRFHGTNYHTQDLVISVQRGNGSTWIERTIPAGEPFEEITGGPVRYETDVPSWSWSWA